MINLIENCAKNTFKIDIYGSLNQGLAIESSDMDLAITGLDFRGNKADVADILESLFLSITDSFPQDLIIDSKCITSTDFPLIKLVVKSSKIEHHFRIKSPDLSSPIEQIEIDIIIHDSHNGVHRGKQTSDFVKSALSFNPALKPVCIMLKKLL